jgi:hypothetical protein
MSVKTLPPVIKQLLAGRSPNSLPSPPLANLQRAFAQTIADARAQPTNVEKGWLVVSVRIIYHGMGYELTRNGDLRATHSQLSSCGRPSISFRNA